MPMGRPFRGAIPQRFLYKLRGRLAFVLLIFVLFEQYNLFFRYREALAAKYSPTELPTFVEQQSCFLDEESADYQDRLIGSRAAWKTLREGWEGRTFMYEDSVIKTFTPARSPFRNCAPGSAGERWPTEIPASLHFGGSKHNLSFIHDGFLPVQAFFMATSSADQAEWFLVTPLVKSGNLQNLAIEVRKQEIPYRDIDAQYRPVFADLLRSMQALHEAGYCHDDVKPGNILVADEAHWILGDLGNLRHASHPYHTSLLWRENRQLIGCRENDVFRALKTYMRFIRDAAVDVDTFNAEFFGDREPLSRLFWSAAADALHLSGEELRSRMAAISSYDANNTFSEGALAIVPSFTWLSILSRRWGRHYAVDQALQTRIGEKLARWWALTWVFGVPVATICRHQ